jgi:hypothetical protein
MSRSSVAVGLLLAATGILPPPPAVVVLPVVALDVQFRGPDYEQRIEDPAHVRQAVEDTLRTILRQQFGFIAWSDGATAEPETLEVEVFKLDTGLASACLRLELRGQVAVPDISQCPMEFEKWRDIINRRDWSPDSLRNIWGRTFDSLLAARRDRLVDERLSQLAFNATVTLDFANLQAVLPLSLSDIKASTDSQDVQFTLRMVLRDNGVPHPTRDPNAALLLTGCLPPDEGNGLVCDITILRYKGVEEAARNKLALLQRATLESLSLHVKKYRPAAPFPVSDHGLVEGEHQ